MTRLLGLTGSIGMGKSTTAQMFRDEGIPVWDADATVHALYAKGGAAVIPLQQIYPEAIKSGSVDRDVLKSIIAEDSAALDMIETIVHPLVAQDRQQFIETHDDPLLVFDIPLLFETGADQWLSPILVVTAPPHVQKARVVEREGMTKTHFDTILAKQMSDAEKRARADFVIETTSMDKTRQDVQALIKQLLGPSDA